MQFLGMSGSGLGSESPATVAQFKAQTGVTFPLLLGDTTKALYAVPDEKITPYPLDVGTDKNGTIVYLRHELDAVSIEETIKQHLN